MKKIIYSILIAVSAITLNSCSDFFNPDTSDILLEKDYVGDYTELYSGYMGLAATVQQVADQSSFLEGLRGDFLEPTPNAPREIWDVYNHEDLTNNTFASPKGYYSVIINANDYLAHAFAYRKKDSTSVNTTTFNGMIGGALRYKAWAYLQLAKMYGEAVYFDEPITAYGQISQYPVMKFDDLIAKCIDLVETGMNGVNGGGTVTWSTELFPNQGASPTSLSWDKICPPKECLLAELYLYQNNFSKAKENCLAIIKKGGENEASYQLNLSESGSDWKTFGNTYVRKEQICVQFYDYSLGQTNRLIQYYSNIYPNKYYLRPAAAGIKRFQTQTIAGVLADKYRGAGATYNALNGDTVVYKFILANLTADKAYTNDVQISLYRAGEIHLFLVEALIGLGRFQEALAILNKGVSSFYNTNTGKFNAPFTDFPSCLYVTSSTGDKANAGIRGRVSLDAVGTFALTAGTALDTLTNMQRLDSLVVEETGLEFAGEGKAYYAMNRMARRWSATADRSWANTWAGRAPTAGTTVWGARVQNYWATQIASKYKNGKAAGIQSVLQGGLDNWFMKYKVTE